MNKVPNDTKNTTSAPNNLEISSIAEFQPEAIKSSRVMQRYVHEIMSYSIAILRYKNDSVRNERIDKEVAQWTNIAREVLYRVSKVLITFLREGKDNERVFRALTEVNLALDTEVKSIFDAVLTLDAAFQKHFPWISIRIILANDDIEGVRSKNPIANMLADMIEIGQQMDTDMIAWSSKPSNLQKIAHLLPVVQGTIANEHTLPDEIGLIAEKGYRNLLKGDKQFRFIEADEAKLLDPNIFGKNVGSALFHKLKNIGTIAFLAEDPNRFQEDMNTLVIENELRKIAMTLGHIASREENSKDTLTKLPTRRYLLQKLDSLFEQAMESQTYINFVLIDLDRFKSVNDTYGHSAGDFVLKTFANILATKLNSDDEIVRWGGEEFAIILKALPIDAAKAVQRVAGILRSYTFGIDDAGKNILYPPGKPIPKNIRTYRVTMSAGIETMSSEEISGLDGKIEEVFEKMVSDADARLYISKEHGRDKVIWAWNEEEIKNPPVVIA